MGRNHSWASAGGGSPWQSLPGGCVLTVVTGRGKARDVFSQSSLKEELQVSYGLPEEGERQEANCVICCTLFGSGSHTALLVTLPVSFK